MSSGQYCKQKPFFVGVKLLNYFRSFLMRKHQRDPVTSDLTEYENRLTEYENRLTEYENRLTEYKNRLTEYEENRLTEYEENRLTEY